MFGKKKKKPSIDKDQLELIENAQKRIRKKKRVFKHTIIFLLGTALFLIINFLLGIGKHFTLASINWSVYLILGWFFILAYHFVNVFVTQRFLGQSWENRQLQKLMTKQNERIEHLQQKLLKDQVLLAKKTKVPTKQNHSANITLIAAVGEDHSIGKDNDLIWALKDDLKRFKALTNGHNIIMGRKTFESFQKPLPNRTHIVMTRQDNYTVPEGVIVVHNLEDALDAAKQDNQPYIIGGGEIYKQALDFANCIQLTLVHEKFPEADTYFPEIDPTIWKEISRQFHNADEKNNYPFSFITYAKI